MELCGTLDSPECTAVESLVDSALSALHPEDTDPIVSDAQWLVRSCTEERSPTCAAVLDIARDAAAFAVTCAVSVVGDLLSTSAAASLTEFSCIDFLRAVLAFVSSAVTVVQTCALPIVAGTRATCGAALDAFVLSVQKALGSCVEEATSAAGVPFNVEPDGGAELGCFALAAFAVAGVNTAATAATACAAETDPVCAATLDILGIVGTAALACAEDTAHDTAGVDFAQPAPTTLVDCHVLVQTAYAAETYAATWVGACVNQTNALCDSVVTTVVGVVNAVQGCLDGSTITVGGTATIDCQALVNTVLGVVGDAEAIVTGCLAGTVDACHQVYDVRDALTALTTNCTATLVDAAVNGGDPGGCGSYVATVRQALDGAAALVQRCAAGTEPTCATAEEAVFGALATVVGCASALSQVVALPVTAPPYAVDCRPALIALVTLVRAVDTQVEQCLSGTSCPATPYRLGDFLLVAGGCLEATLGGAGVTDLLPNQGATCTGLLTEASRVAGAVVTDAEACAAGQTPTCADVIERVNDAISAATACLVAVLHSEHLDLLSSPDPDAYGCGTAMDTVNALVAAAVAEVEACINQTAGTCADVNRDLGTLLCTVSSVTCGPVGPPPTTVPPTPTTTVPPPPVSPSPTVPPVSPPPVSPLPDTSGLLGDLDWSLPTDVPDVVPIDVTVPETYAPTFAANTITDGLHGAAIPAEDDPLAPEPPAVPILAPLPVDPPTDVAGTDIGFLSKTAAQRDVKWKATHSDGSQVDASVAAGDTEFIEAINYSLTVYRKSDHSKLRNAPRPLDLYHWNDGNKSYAATDPHIVFNPRSHRYYITYVNKLYPNKLYLAMVRDGAALNSWCAWEITVPGVPSGHFLDFDLVGFSRDWVSVTAREYQGSWSENTENFLREQVTLWNKSQVDGCQTLRGGRTWTPKDPGTSHYGFNIAPVTDYDYDGTTTWIDTYNNGGTHLTVHRLLSDGRIESQRLSVAKYYGPTGSSQPGGGTPIDTGTSSITEATKVNGRGGAVFTTRYKANNVWHDALYYLLWDVAQRRILKNQVLYNPDHNLFYPGYAQATDGTSPGVVVFNVASSTLNPSAWYAYLGPNGPLEYARVLAAPNEHASTGHDAEVPYGDYSTAAVDASPTGGGTRFFIAAQAGGGNFDYLGDTRYTYGGS